MDGPPFQIPEYATGYRLQSAPITTKLIWR